MHVRYDLPPVTVQFSQIEEGEAFLFRDNTPFLRLREASTSAPWKGAHSINHHAVNLITGDICYIGEKTDVRAVTAVVTLTQESTNV